MAIEGTIGAGKTTLASHLSRIYNGLLVPEEFENNPFLPRFYEDPERHAFALELFFLAERFHQLSKVTGTGLFSEFIVSDYYLEKSLIFAKNNLNADEFELFHRLYSIMYNKLVKPDLLIYLYLPVEKLMTNIRARGRGYEQKISPSYLENIQSTYLDHFNKMQDYRIVLLDYGKINFSENPSEVSLVYDLLAQDFPHGITRISL
ncbi:MAG: deoxynucleoside kinase [Bacteroidota bacterium]